MNIFDYIEKDNKYIPIIQRVGKIADKLNINIFIVGGFVRDCILKRERKEIDFSIDYSIDEFMPLLTKEFNVSNFSIYKNYGTGSFTFDDVLLEFVSMRKESYHKDSRKPDVAIGSFEDDIMRRDFTINTLAISINKENFGKIIDTYNGLSDIQNKLIKTPLDPDITFSDDPLRIMRAFRFATQLNFNIDQITLDSIIANNERLNIVSLERIVVEFFKILMSDKPSIGIGLMFETGVLKILYPEIFALAGVDQIREHHHKDVFWHTLQVVDNIASYTDKLELRLAALFHDIAKPLTKNFLDEKGYTFYMHDELGAKILKKLFIKYKFPLTHLEYIKKLVRLHLRPIALIDDNVSDSAIRRLIVNAGEDLDDLILLCKADITSKNPDKIKKYLNNYERLIAKIEELIERDKLRNFQSPVKGDEIMKIFNLKPSKAVGIIKDKLEEEILEGRLANDYESTIKYIMENFDYFNNLINNCNNKNLNT